MKSPYRKLKNDGSTLLVVIICLAFVGILGSLMLSVSMVNLQMKRVESNAKVNFYSCETALEEIRIGLDELTSATIKEHYEYILKNYVNYATKEEALRNSTIQEEILLKLATSIGIDCTSIATKFESYLSMPADDFTITIVSVEQVKTAVPYSFLFHDVKIVYVKDGYQTSITSDIRATLPSFTFTTGTDTTTYSMEQPYEYYALVADGGIYSKNSTGVNKITGNVYAGSDGITVSDTGRLHSHVVTISGSSIATRGSIKVQDTATLSIGTMGDSNRPIIWANNLLTETTRSYIPGSTLTTNLNINAICLLKDDFTLDGRNSRATLTGAYVGYSGEHTVSGSAIIINGSGSDLDLSGLSSLVIAGRAHVSVEDSMLNTITTESDINIMTGESVAFKSNQGAYLVPGKYIKEQDNDLIMHNPVTQKDILASGIPKVEIPNTDPPGLAYGYYTKAWPDQYKIAAKQTIEGDITTTLRYYYLNFSSGKMADQYLVDYINMNPDALKLLDAFSLGYVKVPTTRERIIAAGNIMSYDSVTKTIGCIQGNSDTFGDDGALDAAIAGTKFADINYDAVFQGTELYDKQISNLPKLYSKITHLLSLDSTQIYSEADKAVDATILDSGISGVSSQLSSTYPSVNPGFTYYGTLPTPTPNVSVWNSSSPTDKSFVVINGDAEIAMNSYFNGVFIASGNIKIGEGATINGIIIAAGGSSGPGDIEIQKNAKIYGRIIAANNITLKENCIIDCTTKTSFDPTLTVDDFLKDIFRLDGQLLWKMFKNPEVTINFSSSGTPSDLVDLSNLVTCENWRKK